MQYHCLLIGLQDLQLDTKQKLTEAELVELISRTLTARDLRLFREVQMQPSDDEITALLPKEDEETEEKSPLSESDQRWQLVYARGARSTNAFVREWYAFNLNLNNVLTAAICRKHGFDVKKAIVGEGAIQDALRTSHARDFGLQDSFEELDDILRLSEIDDLYEREKKTDALRWRWLEEHTFFHYFEVENVLAYYLMAKMLYRWDILNVEEGQKVFRALIADMKRDVHFDK